jgi:hypothetical protein
MISQLTDITMTCELLIILAMKLYIPLEIDGNPVEKSPKYHRVALCPVEPVHLDFYKRQNFNMV